MWSSRFWRVIGLLASIIVLAEGSLLIAVAAPATLARIGGIQASTVLISSVQLAALGILSTVLIFLPRRAKDPSEGASNKFASLTILIVGAIIALEGLLIAFAFGAVTMQGMGTIPSYLVSAFGGQLLLLGSIIMLAHLLRKTRIFLPRLVSYACALMVAASAVVIMGVTAETDVAGHRTSGQSTMLFVGLQLLLLATTFVIISVASEKSSKRGRLSAYLMQAFSIAIALEGIAMMALASPIYVSGLGTIPVQYLLAGGLIPAALGVFMVGSNGWNDPSSSPKYQRISLFIALFLLLLIPISAFVHYP